MSKHGEEGHEHTLLCLDLETLSAAAANVAESLLKRPVHFIHFYVDGETVALASDIPPENIPEVVKRIAEATAAGAYAKARDSGETMQ